MFRRHIDTKLELALQESAAVVLLGPRQIGKTTLAYELAQSGGAYFDLESPEDRSKLADVEHFLRARLNQLVVLDEVQRMPTLFESLRGLIDHARRQQVTDQRLSDTGLYLLLGSASLDLIQKSSETLAGRVAFMELSGLHRLEVSSDYWESLWLRGGFPRSLLATSDEASARWRRNFTRTYLERNVAQFAPRIAAEMLRRFWVMVAHLQGSMVNVADLARNLGVDTRTAGGYLDLLVDLLLVRKLPPWHNNQRKRLVKSPKIYIRDSGVLHSLLGISEMEGLLSHPVVGASWEGHVIESLLAVMPDGVNASFYRTSAGAEIDLLLTWPDASQWAIEIKRSTTPKVERGFHVACEDLLPAKKWLIYPGTDAYSLGNDIICAPLDVAMKELADW